MGRRPFLYLLVSLVVGVGVLIGLFVARTGVLAQSGTPVPAPLILPMDAFYERPATIPDEPGMLLKSDPLLDRELPANAQAWRIQYATTLPDGSPGVAVATVLAPAELPPGSLPVITWEHGTVGILQRCMLSLARTPFAGIPALDQVVDQGWVLVATDYAVNDRGMIPYLIGNGEAHSALDAVRAARQMPELELADKTVVWGHSQGGQSALWTGMIGDDYAPDIDIAGVAALAPATDMAGILASHEGDPTGARQGAYGAMAYSQYFPDVVFEETVSPEALDIARQMADLCQFDPVDIPTLQTLTAELDGQPVVIDPYAGTLGKRLKENLPGGEISAPLMIAQRLDDVMIDPSFNDDFVSERCADGQSLLYWRIPGRDHGGIVQPDSPLTSPLIAWTADRFAGVSAPTGCVEETIEYGVTVSAGRENRANVTKTKVSMWNAILGFRRAVQLFGGSNVSQITLADVAALADDAGSRPPAGFRYVSGFATEHTISDSQRRVCWQQKTCLNHDRGKGH